MNNKQNNNELVIDAFDGKIADYERAMKEFGIEPIQQIPVLGKLSPEQIHKYIKRDIMTGHTDAEQIFQSVLNKKPFAVMSGLKPTGPYHIGSLTTCNEVIYFQELGGEVFYCIADIEGYCANAVSLKKGMEIAIDNIADVLALGLDPDRARIYRQSETMEVLRFGAVFANKVTYNMIKAIYGERRFGLYQSALIQAGDILLPQLEEYGGPRPTVTPIGFDQAPHARLTRDLVRKQEFQDDYGFVKPSFTFHILIQGIDGSEKMSKRNEMSLFTLNEDSKSVKRKIMNAFTGGRNTAEEQRQLGGQPEVCRIFDLYKFFFIEKEKDFKERKRLCTSGEILCGACKKHCLELVKEFLRNHQEIKKSKFDLARELVIKGTP
ncbi:MAG: tryptophan--tRNA ligase [Candidatus Hodarchaeota archaeon]